MKKPQVEAHYQTTLSAGSHWSFKLRRGLLLQLTDETGGANVGMLLYNADNLLERYNAPDTLKCQHTFHLTQGHCLYSDMGHVLASVVEDSVGAHETICGNSTRNSVRRTYGERSYQQDRNSWYQNGHDAFLVELAKYGLERRDLPASINWFSACAIKEEGDIALRESPSPKGSQVSLRMDMDCIVVLHTCPHPMNLQSVYPESQVRITLADAPPMSMDDLCANHCEENRRGFENNRLYHLGSA